MDTSLTKTNLRDEDNMEAATEERRQPSEASTVIMSEYADSHNGDHDAEESRVRSPIQSSPLEGAPLPDPALADGQLNTTCPETIVCSVDPSDFPEGPHGMDVESDTTLVGGVVPHDDGSSVAESIKTFAGKRRRREILSDSGDNDSDAGFRRRLRSRKTRVLDTTVEDGDKSDPCSRPAVLSSPAILTTGDAGSSVQSGVEYASASENKKKKKCTKKKTSPIAPKMHPLLDSDQLADHTTSGLAALAMDWIEDIELIRVRSTGMQGVVSRYVKERLVIIRECFRVLHDHSMRADDPTQLRLRSARLVAELHSAQEENAQLRLQLKSVQEMRQADSRNKPMCSVGTSTSPCNTEELQPGTDEKNINIHTILEDIKNRILLLESSNHKKEEIDAEPLPQRKPRVKPTIKSVTEINPPRRVTIIDARDTYLSGSPGPDDPGPGPVDVPRPGPGPGLPEDPVTETEEKKDKNRAKDSSLCPRAGPRPGASAGPGGSGVLVPEKEKRKDNKYRSSDTEGNKSRDEDFEHWKTVESKKKKKKLRKRDLNKKKDGIGKPRDGEKGDRSKDSSTERNPKISRKPTSTAPSSPPSGKSAIQILQKKLPKASAVVIKGKSENFSYADALSKLRKEIPLAEIGINSTKIKKTAGGAVLIEVPGVDSKELAEELRTRAAKVLGDGAAVLRPEIKGEIRVVGFDESVDVSDISKGIAKVGGCTVSEITVTPITPMKNGLYMTWIKCPLAAAIKASKNGKIPLGWTMARLELQKPRTPRCFRCWEPGHHQRTCRSEVDRSHACFRCGENGHAAALCVRETFCVLCAARGLHARHRCGSYGYAVIQGNDPDGSVRRPTVALPHDGNQVDTMQLE